VAEFSKLLAEVIGALEAIGGLKARHYKSILIHYDYLVNGNKWAKQAMVEANKLVSKDYIQEFTLLGKKDITTDSKKTQKAHTGIEFNGISGSTCKKSVTNDEL